MAGVVGMFERSRKDLIDHLVQISKGNIQSGPETDRLLRSHFVVTSMHKGTNDCYTTCERADQEWWSRIGNLMIKIGFIVAFIGICVSIVGCCWD